VTGDGDTGARTAPRDAVVPTLALVGWCGFAWYIFWQGTVGQPLIWSDSSSYATVAGHPLWSTGFWAGQRPPLVPFLLKVAGSATGFVALQSVLAVGAWGFLAFTVGRLVPDGWRRLAAVWIVLAFATTTPITLWNRSVLSESLSLSLLALLIAATIWAVRALTWPRVVALAGVALLFAATRDAQVWTVGALGVVVGVVALARWRRHRPPSRPIVALAVSLLLAAGVTGWVVVHTGRSRQNVENVLYVRIFPFPSRVAWFAAHGLPDARAIDRSMAVTKPPTPGAAKVFNVDDPKILPLEATLDTWMLNHGQSTYLLWLVTHPTYIVTEPLQRPERSFNFAGGLLTFYAATDRVTSPATPVLWPAWWWLLPLTVIGVAASVVGGAWRRRSTQAVVMLGVLGIFTMLVAWHGDGQEVTRHTIEGFAEVRLCVLILAVVGVLPLIPSRPRPVPVETVPVETVAIESAPIESVSEESVSEETAH
jgi:hypothetical protein